MKTLIFLLMTLVVLLLTGCGGGSSTDSDEDEQIVTIGTRSEGTGSGSIEPMSRSVVRGSTVIFTVNADDNSIIESVTGCGGTLVSGVSTGTYTISSVGASCTVVYTLTEVPSAPSVTINTELTGSGSARMEPSSLTLPRGGAAMFSISVDPGSILRDVNGCGGSLSTSRETYTVFSVTENCTISYTADELPTVTINTQNAGSGSGVIDPRSRTLTVSQSAIFTITPDAGSILDEVSGCGGTLSREGTAGVYTIDSVVGDCTVTYTFTALPTFTVTTQATGSGSGRIEPTSRTVSPNSPTSFIITPDQGSVLVDVEGCGGSLLEGGLYSIPSVTAPCVVTYEFFSNPPAPLAPVVSVSAQAIKTFRFSWISIASADSHTLFEDPDGASGFSAVVEGIVPAGPPSTSVDLSQVPLYARTDARYIVDACNSDQCSGSAELEAPTPLDSAIGYFKSNHTQANDQFGSAIALSEDGTTMAVGAPGDDGTRDDPTDESETDSGAVIVYSLDASGWVQQAYIKPNLVDSLDRFGEQLSLSADGNVLVVGVPLEDSSGTGINNGNSASPSPADDTAQSAGAVYVFVRDDNNIWSQQTYIKASNASAGDQFGSSVSLSSDGRILAVGAKNEASASQGVNSDQSSNAFPDAGAVYVYRYNGSNWLQQAYIKASNTAVGNRFGTSVSVNTDGSVLAVGAPGESSSATGVNGDQNQNINQTGQSGAAYLFARGGDNWVQTEYIKASNTGVNDVFGSSLAINGAGDVLVVGAFLEGSGANGVNGDQTDTLFGAGAAYVFEETVDTWNQSAYLKASNTTTGSSFDGADLFGSVVDISDDGNHIFVSAPQEESDAIGINGDEFQDGSFAAGSVYYFVRDGQSWQQQSYIKATNTQSSDFFG